MFDLFQRLSVLPSVTKGTYWRVCFSSGTLKPRSDLRFK